MQRTGRGAAKVSSKNGSCPAELAVHGWDHDASKERPPLDSTLKRNALMFYTAVRGSVHAILENLLKQEVMLFFFAATHTATSPCCRSKVWEMEEVVLHMTSASV